MFTAVTSGLRYRFDNTVLGYAIVISAVLLIYTLIFFPGIRKDGINIFMGVNPLFKNVSFNDINSSSLKEDNNNLKLLIKSYGSIYPNLCY